MAKRIPRRCLRCHGPCPPPDFRMPGVRPMFCEAFCEAMYLLDTESGRKAYLPGRLRQWLTPSKYQAVVEHRMALAAERRVARREVARLKRGTKLSPESRAAAHSRLPLVCEICGSTKRLNIDHCHVHGHVRGRLCNSCNTGLGRFKDDPAMLQAAIDYLRRYQ